MGPALVFDLDGTLVDSLPGIATALNLALREHGQAEHPADKVREFVGSGAFLLCRRAIAAGETDELARAVEQSFKRHYADCWAAGTTLYPGIDRLVERLAAAGARLAVLSNKPDAFTREMVGHLFPAGPFEVVRGQIDGSPRKPDPRAVLPILDHWGIGPAGARLIGDSSIDRDTAVAAGIPFIGVAWGYQSDDAVGPDPARSVADLAMRLSVD